MAILLCERCKQDKDTYLVFTAERIRLGIKEPQRFCKECSDIELSKK